MITESIILVDEAPTKTDTVFLLGNNLNGVTQNTWHAEIRRIINRSLEKEKHSRRPRDKIFQSLNSSYLCFGFFVSVAIDKFWGSVL